jgi:hypothetical protein
MLNLGLSRPHRLLSADTSTPVYCLPLVSASCLPAGCRVAPVVAQPLTPPHDFASTSSLPAGCRNLQRPTCCTATASCPLAASASRRAASASQRVTATGCCVVARCQCADVVAVNAQASSSSLSSQFDCRPRRLSPSESPYGFGDHHMEKLITVSIWGFDTNGSPLPYGDPNMGTGSDISPYGNG